MIAKILLSKLDVLPKELSGELTDRIFIDVIFPDIGTHAYRLQFDAPLTKEAVEAAVKTLATKLARQVSLKSAAVSFIETEFAGLEINTSEVK